METRATAAGISDTAAGMRDNKHYLSINSYKEVLYEEKSYEKPSVIIDQIETLDKERGELLKQLKSMLA